MACRPTTLMSAITRPGVCANALSPRMMNLRTLANECAISLRPSAAAARPDLICAAVQPGRSQPMRRVARLLSVPQRGVNTETHGDEPHPVSTLPIIGPLAATVRHRGGVHARVATRMLVERGAAATGAKVAARIAMASGCGNVRPVGTRRHCSAARSSRPPNCRSGHSFWLLRSILAARHMFNMSRSVTSFKFPVKTSTSLTTATV